MRFLLLMLLLPAIVGADPLSDKLQPLIRAHKGKVAVAVKDLTSGDSFTFQAGEVMPTASLIKLPIMIEVYFQVKEGKVRLEEMLTLTKEEMVPGSGILTAHFSPGAKFSLRDAVRLMIVFSDNTATNMVLEKVGIAAVNARMKALGFAETRIHAKVFKASTTSIDPERTKKYGLGSTTCTEMLGLLQKLHAGELVSPEASKEMIEHLKKCDDAEKFPRFLPKDVVIAHKTGSVSNARTDAGILYLKSGPILMCVLTDQNEDKSWSIDNTGNKFCAEIAKAVVEILGKK